MAQLLPQEKMIEANNEALHGEITGEEAEKRLRMCGDHCHLVRYSEKRECYVLSVFKSELGVDKCKHFEIKLSDKGGSRSFQLDSSKTFDSLRSMLNHYREKIDHPALENGIGQCVTKTDYAQRYEEERQAIEQYPANIDEHRGVEQVNPNHNPQLGDPEAAINGPPPRPRRRWRCSIS